MSKNKSPGQEFYDDLLATMANCPKDVDKEEVLELGRLTRAFMNLMDGLPIARSLAVLSAAMDLVTRLAIEDSQVPKLAYEDIERCLTKAHARRLEELKEQLEKKVGK